MCQAFNRTRCILTSTEGMRPSTSNWNIPMSLDRAMVCAVSSMIRGATSPDRDREAKTWMDETAPFWPDPRIGSLRAGAQNAHGTGPHSIQRLQHSGNRLQGIGNGLRFPLQYKLWGASAR